MKGEKGINIKERAYRILKEKRGHVFIPRWDLLYGALLSTRGMGRLEGLPYYDASRELGFGIACTRNKAYSERIEVEAKYESSVFETITTYQTPYGDLRTVYKTTEELQRQGVRGLTTEFLVKKAEDIDAAIYLIEHTEIVPEHQKIEQELKNVGNDGIVAAQAGYVPYHEFMRVFAGYEASYYLMEDVPLKVEALTCALEAKFEKIKRVCLESPADIITVDGHFNNMLIPPNLYREKMMSELLSFGEEIHNKGKYFCSHTDAEMKGFLDMYLETGFDIAEAYTPPPMTNASLEDAYAVWGDKITIWGGIASCLLSKQASEEEFLAHAEKTLQETSGKGFIAGIGDNAPTDAVMSRMELLRDMFM